MSKKVYAFLYISLVSGVDLVTFTVRSLWVSSATNYYSLNLDLFRVRAKIIVTTT